MEGGPRADCGLTGRKIIVDTYGGASRHGGAYAIGVARPVSIEAECFGTERLDLAVIRTLISEHFDLRPGAILRDPDLRRPIYARTAGHGHFGGSDPDFTWERTDKPDALRRGASLSSEIGLEVPAPAGA